MNTLDTRIATVAVAADSSSLTGEDKDWLIVTWILAADLLGMSAFCVARALWVVFKENGKFFSVRKLLHVLLFIPILLRGLDWSIWAQDVLVMKYSEQTIEQVVLGSLGGYTFFTTYSLLFSFWIVMYHSMYNKTAASSVQRLKNLFIGLNVLLYTIYLIIIVSLAFTTAKARYTIHTVETIFASLISFFAALAFGPYGFMLYWRIHKHSQRSQSPPNVSSGSGRIPLLHQQSSVNSKPANAASSFSRKIGILTLVFTFCFLTRGVCVLLDWYVRVLWFSRACRIFFTCVCELFPTAVTLAILWKPFTEVKPGGTPSTPNPKDPLLGGR